jgi:hypothetical protein
VFQTSEILARLHGLVAEVVRWGPAVPLAAMAVVALAAALVLPGRYRVKGASAAVVAACAIGAFAFLRWERQLSGESAAAQLDSRITAEAAALHGLWTQLDGLSQTLPAPSGEAPAASFDSVDAAVAALGAKIATIKDQVAALKSGSTARAVDPAVATKLADYLRRYGSYRVVVSCVPADVEAYNYATQLVDILKSAGWDANGPEQTANVLDGPAMGITVLDRDSSAPDAAKILLDAFTQFDIPHTVGISADYAIPDSATAELFVARKP